MVELETTDRESMIALGTSHLFYVSDAFDTYPDTQTFFMFINHIDMPSKEALCETLIGIS